MRNNGDTYKNFPNFGIRRRLAAFFLAILFVFTVISPIWVGAVSDVGHTDKLLLPIYAGKSYSVSLRNAGYVEGRRDDGKMLTDRVFTKVEFKDGYPEDWVMISGEKDYRVTVTCDLGEEVPGLCYFFLRTAKSLPDGAEVPNSIKISISSDGASYRTIGSLITKTDFSSETTGAIYRLDTTDEYSARYVRFVMECEGGKILMLNEVGVCVNKTAFRTNESGDGRFFDEQGVEYIVKNGVAEVIGTAGRNVHYSADLTPSAYSFDKSGISYKLGIRSDNEIEVISDFIEKSQVNWSGIPNKVNKIVIHNTATVEESTNAELYNRRQHTATTEVSWHYTVDENIIYHSLSDSIVGWHAGTVMNYESIGIEICVNGAPTDSKGNFVLSGAKYDKWVDERFRKSIKNAAVLTAELLTRYGLGLDAVVQHYDASGKNCPLWMRSTNGGKKFVHDGTLWVEFMDYVREYYSLLNDNSVIKYGARTDNITIPDYIILPDGSICPVRIINNRAFTGASESLNSLYIPATVTSIDNGAFEECDMLDDIKIADDSVSFKIVDGVLTSADGRKIFDPSSLMFAIPKPKAGSTLDLRRFSGRYHAYISQSGYTLNDFLDDYGYPADSAVSPIGNRIKNGDILGTGAHIDVGGARVYIILRGDGNGDGKIGVEDYIMCKRIFIGNYNASTTQNTALALTDGEKIALVDYVKLKRHVLGTYDIYN